MLRSLVGSEMCIRDRYTVHLKLVGDFLLVIIELFFARCFRFVTIHASDKQTDGQNFDSKVRSNEVRCAQKHQRTALCCRSIVVHRCGSAGATVWSQEVLACVKPGSLGPQAQPPRNRSTGSDGGHRQPYYLIYSHKRRENTTPATAGGKSNPCRRGGAPFYLPHPTRSSMYIQCGAEGQAFVRKCPRGTRWNQRATTCDRSVPGTFYKLH